MTLAEIMTAIKADTTLTGLLADGAKSIYHLQSPDAGTYPVLVVSIISDVPHVQYDNIEGAGRQTVRFQVLTTDGRYQQVISALQICLGNNPDLKRKSTYEHIEDGLFVKTIDYTNIY